MAHISQPQHNTTQHSLAPKDNTCHHDTTHIADQIEGVVLSNRCIEDAAKLGLRGVGGALLATRPGA